MEPSERLAQAIVDRDIEGVVIKDRIAPYRSGSRKRWAKVKAPDWHERHRERFHR